MTQQNNWVSLALKIIDKQNPHEANGAKTIRYIQSYLDALLDKGKLTEAQSNGLIRNIDIHLSIAIPSQIVQISRKTAWAWKKKSVGTPAPKSAQPLTIEDHWQALLAHYGDYTAVANAAIDRIERDAEQDAPAAQPAPEAPVDRQQQVTVSIWERTRSGNLDYKDGSKEHVVFHDAKTAKRKLDKAGAPDTLWRSLQTALDGFDDCDLQFGTVHREGDPKGNQTPSTNDCVVVKVVPHGRADKRSVMFVQSACPMTAVAGMDGWKKTKRGHPDIKGYVKGLAA